MLATRALTMTVQRVPYKINFPNIAKLSAPKLAFNQNLKTASGVAGMSSLSVLSRSSALLTAVKLFQKQPSAKQLLLIQYRGIFCVKDEMEKHCIVPDVIPVAPEGTAEVCFPSNVSAQMGNELTPTQVKCPPEVSWNADPKSFYTMAMVDPDAPSRGDPSCREWLHWLVGNIPGEEVVRGDVLAEYIGSGPPKDTGLHRYIYLIYKQDKRLCFDETRLLNNSADGRANFKIGEFAKKYNLGNPIAGNFYQSEYDDYVPQLYRQLGAA